ncbi:MAG: hypothetical protein JSS61_07210 [Verrucomicrobia bacterium]|nr:hypothetical protein [Verrucomicrobiota bacterium]
MTSSVNNSVITALDVLQNGFDADSSAPPPQWEINPQVFDLEDFALDASLSPPVKKRAAASPSLPKKE